MGKVVWAAAVIRKKSLEGDLLAEKVRSLKINNEALEQVKNAQKEAIDLALNAEALAIYDAYFKGDDNKEQIERVKYSIKTFADLLDRGAQIQPALMAPEEAKNLFPNYGALDTVISQIRQLENKSTEPSE